MAAYNSGLKVHNALLDYPSFVICHVIEQSKIHIILTAFNGVSLESSLMHIYKSIMQILWQYDTNNEEY